MVNATFFFMIFCTVQLHSKLADPSQLQLVGVGVDFVFPSQEEGRRRRKNQEPTPCFYHFLNLVAVLWLSGTSLEGVWRVPEGCLEGV